MKVEKNEDYIEVSFHVKPRDPWVDLFPAELFLIGFESCSEDPDLKGYIKEPEWDAHKLEEVIADLPPHVECTYETKKIPFQNWNQSWENNYKPIEIGKKCRIRASFHDPSSDYDYEVQIEPKMAFGTGHHDTTYQIAEAILDNPPAGEKVLDMGCGTALLGILASKLGAAEVWAADIDPAAVNSSRENAELNETPNIHILKADAPDIEEKGFGVILANINRNVILDHLPEYSRMLKSGGTVYTSGFYIEDADMVTEKAEQHNFKETARNSRNGWAMLTLQKK